MSDREIISDVKELWDDFYNQHGEWRTEAEEDFMMTLGDQWGFLPETMRLNGRPELSINIIQNQSDLLAGIQRQNRSDLKALPMEGGDEEGADVYSQMFKWILHTRGGHHMVSAAWQNAVICGVGYIHPYMCYDEDFINGEIKVTSEDPFRILLDPYMTMPDLSDCNNILRHAYLSKERAALLWPEKEKEIKKLHGSRQIPISGLQEEFGQIDDKLNIIERWYKKKSKREFLYDQMSGIVKSIPRNVDRNQFVEQSMQTGQFSLIEGNVNEIFLTIIAQDDLVIYDGQSPYSWNMYPFIPIFYRFEPAYPKWKWRLQGFVRKLKDVQIEKNKRRSQIMNAILSTPQSGYFVRRGANVDPNQLKEPGVKIVDVGSMDDIREIQSNNMVQPVAMLEQQLDQDINKMGLNPDLQGMIGGSSGGSAASAAGVSLRLRQQQGLTIVQTPFDNLSFSLKSLGRLLIDMINENYDVRKIARITGDNIKGVKQLKAVREQITVLSSQQPQTEEEALQLQAQVQQAQLMENAISQKIEEFWLNFASNQNFANYDCVVDEVQSAPTHRTDVRLQLMEMIHQAFPVPPQVIIEYMDIAPSVKEEWINYLRAQQQAQQQAQQEEMDAEKNKQQLEAETRIKTAMINKFGGKDGK